MVRMVRILDKHRIEIELIFMVCFLAVSIVFFFSLIQGARNHSHHDDLELFRSQVRSCQRVNVTRRKVNEIARRLGIGTVEVPNCDKVVSANLGGG